MAEIETAFPPTEQPPAAASDHHERESVHSSSNEKASPSGEHEHKGIKLATETKESNDLYDPNMYRVTYAL